MGKEFVTFVICELKQMAWLLRSQIKRVIPRTSSVIIGVIAFGTTIKSENLKTRHRHPSFVTNVNCQLLLACMKNED